MKNPDNFLELDALISEIEKLSRCFVRSSNLGLYLKTEDETLFKQKVLEAMTVLDELFGDGNNYSRNIPHTVNQGCGGFAGGPTRKCLLDVVAILKAAQKHAVRGVKIKHDINSYIAMSRLQELKSFDTKEFDITRMIRILEEINEANNSQSLMSIAMLCRTLIDHVPPIFNYKTFAEVTNNYKGTKSFKASMLHLQNSLRNVSDAYLHTCIRKKEVLPTFNQVDFRADIDVLLAEIIRIIKEIN
ncbi:MAG: hypothetical protein JW832_09440 [Deltaproteobacteria bacterium]|nr:hypothetical protein [Deltaproteobacteria bacterium]